MLSEYISKIIYYIELFLLVSLSFIHKHWPIFHRFIQVFLTMSSVNGSANDFLLGMIDTLAAAAGNTSLMSGTKLNKF